MSARPVNPSDPYVVPPHLGRRVVAAGVDAGVVAVCVGAMFVAWSPVMPARGPGVMGVVAGVVLAVAFVVEAVSGRTAGKAAAGLSLAREGNGGVGAYAVRAALRWVPVVAALPAVAGGMHAVFASVVVAMVLGVAAVQACYLALVRTGNTVYDWVARTRIVRVGAGADRMAPG